MFKRNVFSILPIFLYVTEASFPNVYPKIQQFNSGGDPGVPLILTPLIETGQIKEAQAAAENHFSGFKGVKSYSAYLTVNKPYNSNLFFWFFPSTSDYANDPVILWLQGGPGATSLFGLFVENGPFEMKSESELKLRPYSWTKNHSVIFIDNPAGTGYSFTNDGYCRNETQVGQDLYNALLQFFTLFPELQKNEIYITGESYGGKYVPAISYTIHQKNPTAKLKINLKGLAMGNGLSDPVHQLEYGKYLYQIGLIDLNTQTVMQEYEEQGIKYIQQKEWLKACEVFDRLIAIFENVTGFTNYYNYLKANDTDTQGIYMGKYIQRSDVRAAIHVGNSTFHDIINVYNSLKEDVMQSVAPLIAELLSSYRVLIYNGQLDIIVAYPLTLNYLQNLKFNGDAEYKNATRYHWYVNDDLAGFVKQAGNLTEVLVRNAGHMVPKDQPKWAFDLITRFTRNKPFY